MSNEPEVEDNKRDSKIIVSVPKSVLLQFKTVAKKINRSMSSILYLCIQELLDNGDLDMIDSVMVKNENKKALRVVDSTEELIIKKWRSVSDVQREKILNLIDLPFSNGQI